jgi:hypothetical protein
MEQFSIILAEAVKGVGKAGERVSLELQPSDVHDPTELPTYLAGFRPFGFRGDEASPPVLVDNDEDKFRQFSSDDAFKVVDVKGSTGGAVPEVDPKTSLTPFKVVERFVGAFVPRQTELATGNNYQPRMAAARRARWAIELDREIDVWALLGLTTSFAAAQRLALGGTQNWDGGSDSDPIRDLHTAIEASAQMVTDLWMNQKVANAMLRHDKVRDHMRQMLGDSAPNAAIGSVASAGRVNADFVIPGLPPVHVAAGKQLNETTSVLDYILGDVVVLVGRPPGVPTDGEEIATSYTFRRRGPSGVGFEVREFTLENRGPLGGTMMVVSMADIAVMTGNSVGGIISGVHN